METLISIKPLLAVLVSAIAAVLVMLSYKRPELREGWSLGAGAIKLLIVISMTPAVLSGVVIQYTVFKILPGVELAFKVDGIGLLFATTSSFLWIITTVYSMGYMRTLEEHAQTRYYTCFAIALSSAMGVAFAGNLFTLFFFYEILSLCTLPLVIHNEAAKDWDAGGNYSDVHADRHAGIQQGGDVRRTNGDDVLGHGNIDTPDGDEFHVPERFCQGRADADA